MSVITSVFSVIKKNLPQKNISVTAIRLNVGKFSNVIPDALQFAFDSIKKGTVFEKALLFINEIELTCLCNDCNKTVVMTKHNFVCENCGSCNLTIVTGRELFIESIDVENT